MLTVGLYSNGIFRTFTGKTTLMTALAEWYQEQRLPFVLLDLDTENKARGSVAHFFRDRAQKVNIHTPAGLDALWIIWARRSGWCWPTWARAPGKSPRSGLRTSTKMRRRQVSCSPRSACDPDGFSLAGTRKCSAAARRHASLPFLKFLYIC